MVFRALVYVHARACACAWVHACNRFAANSASADTEKGDERKVCTGVRVRARTRARASVCVCVCARVLYERVLGVHVCVRVCMFASGMRLSAYLTVRAYLHPPELFSKHSQ